MSAFAGFNEPVLIVEDEEQIRALIVQVVEDLGLKTLQAASAEEALQIIETQGPTGMPCLVLSDLCMTGMTGIHLCTEIRKTRTEIPFVLISGFIDKSTAIAALQSGVTNV